MTKPYGIISDTHHNNWSAFSTTLEHGVNSRLDILLRETLRCGDAVLAAGGNTIVHAGDMFHVRGSIAPSVLVPTLDTYKILIAKGLHVVILAGNHDLESKESKRVSSAVTALEGIGCRVVNSVNYTPYLDRVCMIPWHQDIGELKRAIEMVDPSDRAGTDLIIHAPVDGVIIGLPDHGLTPTYLASLGFGRVFAGHYHHHKDMGNGVYSIGAIAHHNWGDIGTKAGFLLVGDDVKWNASHAPSFVDVDGSTDPSDIPLIVDGNYVRVKIESTKPKEVDELRAYLADCGALGSVIIPQPVHSTTARTTSTTKAGASLEVSVNDYVLANGFANEKELAMMCQGILAKARGAR